MSVIVKGMEMPKCCAYCEIQYDGVCQMNTVEGIDDIAYDGRPDWCPLVELPEKHGRLIDADELVQTLDSAINLMEPMLDLLELDAEDGCLMELKAYRDIRDGIKELDAILEAEGAEE